MLLIRGDHELNEVKVGKVDGLKGGFRFASEAEILDTFGCRPGYLGPIGTRKPVRLVADRTVANMSDFVSGANEQDFHYHRRQLGARPAGAHTLPMSATSLRAIRRPTARACSPSSAASRSAMCSRGCPIRKR